MSKKSLKKVQGDVGAHFVQEAGVLSDERPTIRQGARESVQSEVNSVRTGTTRETVFRLASELRELGVLDKSTMRHIDDFCLTPLEGMTPEVIRQIRNEAGVSQAVLAHILNVAPNAVGQWERGEKKPTGSAVKLLALLRTKGLDAIL